MVKLIASYIGGPNDGTTEEFEAMGEPGDPPGEIHVYGFDLYEATDLSVGPAGRYEPDPSPSAGLSHSCGVPIRPRNERSA